MAGVRRSSILSTAAALAMVLVAAGCEENPVGTEHEDELTVSLTIDPGHVHILQSEVTYTVDVHDHHGDPVTDFLALEVQRLAEGSDTWRGTALERVGNVWVGTSTFASSGAYGLRVAGQRPGDADLVVLYNHPEPLHAARAHAEAGGYRIEFETFPGHIHEGDEAEARFWVMETERNTEGVRPPITGLSPSVLITEEDGSSTMYAGTEASPGEYEAHHQFMVPGALQITFQFTGGDGQPAEAVFMHDIAHAH